MASTSPAMPSATKANTIVLDCAERTHAHGSIEHAQMLKQSDIPTSGAIGTRREHPAAARHGRPRRHHTILGQSGRGSLRIQQHCTKPERNFLWVPTRRSRRLDPWLAISAAVFGTESSDREPFQPEQCLDFEHRPRIVHRTGAYGSLQARRQRPIWCCSTATQASSMNPESMQRHARTHSRYHAKRALDLPVVDSISLIDGG